MSYNPTGGLIKEDMKIKYIHEPTDLQCGQAVLAMVLGISVEEIIKFLDNDKETNLKEMKLVLKQYEVNISDQRMEANSKDDLPSMALLSLETPRCWHWSLYAEGIFYDPEHGIMNDFPECKRKYYWELRP